MMVSLKVVAEMKWKIQDFLEERKIGDNLDRNIKTSKCVKNYEVCKKTLKCILPYIFSRSKTFCKAKLFINNVWTIDYMYCRYRIKF